MPGGEDILSYGACGAARVVYWTKEDKRLARLDWKRDVFPLLMKTGTGIIIL